MVSSLLLILTFLYTSVAAITIPQVFTTEPYLASSAKVQRFADGTALLKVHGYSSVRLHPSVRTIPSLETLHPTDPRIIDVLQCCDIGLTVLILANMSSSEVIWATSMLRSFDTPASDLDPATGSVYIMGELNGYIHTFTKLSSTGKHVSTSIDEERLDVPSTRFTFNALRFAPPKRILVSSVDYDGSNAIAYLLVRNARTGSLISPVRLIPQSITTNSTESFTRTTLGGVTCSSVDSPFRNRKKRLFLSCFNHNRPSPKVRVRELRIFPRIFQGAEMALSLEGGSKDPTLLMAYTVLTKYPPRYSVRQQTLIVIRRNSKSFKRKKWDSSSWSEKKIDLPENVDCGATDSLVNSDGKFVVFFVCDKGMSDKITITPGGSITWERSPTVFSSYSSIQMEFGSQSLPRLQKGFSSTF